MAELKQMVQNQTLHDMGPIARKPVFEGMRTIKAQISLRSLISAFVIRFLESTISKLTTSEILIF